MDTFQEICRREEALLASRGEFFSRSFGLALSLRITKLFLRVGISEDIAMLLMWLVGMVGAICIALGGGWVAVGFIFLFMHYILDYCDGQLARQHRSSCLVASVRDRWIHFTVQASAFIALGFYFWGAFQTPIHLLAPAFCYIWFQFRRMISHLPEEVFCGEFSGYETLEVEITKENHQKTLAAAPDEPTSASESTTNDEYMKSLRYELRDVSMNFDGFNFIMIGVSIMALAFYYFGLWSIYPEQVILYVVWSFVAFYFLNMLDYTLTYLFSFRINRDMVEMEKKLKRR